MRRTCHYSCFFFFNDTATTEIYTLSLHDALPIFTLYLACMVWKDLGNYEKQKNLDEKALEIFEHSDDKDHHRIRSEEHTSELQSRQYLVCRLLLEKKKKKNYSEQPEYNIL